MPTFSQRSMEKEWMDTRAVSFYEFDECLKHLRYINILTLAYRPTLHWIKDKLYPLRSLSVLDVGSGGGDMLRQIASLATKRKCPVKLTGVDLNPYSERSARNFTSAGHKISYLTANIFSLDQDFKFDVIISSLFTHHLPDDDLVRFIRWMDAHAIQGWFINDLHRHWLPYYFIKFVTHLLPVNKLVRNDAAISVARAFIREDWIRLLDMAGIDLSRVQICWRFPFRYGVSCKAR